MSKSCIKIRGGIMSNEQDVGLRWAIIYCKDEIEIGLNLWQTEEHGEDIDWMLLVSTVHGLWFTILLEKVITI